MKHMYSPIYLISLILFLGLFVPYPGYGQENDLTQVYVKSIHLPMGGVLSFRWIEPGEFIMGSADAEKGRDLDEGPQHRVVIDKGFYIGIYEVTQSQWQSVMDYNPSTFQQGDSPGDRPVESVSWNECTKFIEVLNSKGVGQFRLPTEAEWEYACCANSESIYFGDISQDAIHSYAWCNSKSYATTHPVGQKLPNPWGLYDMVGNVWEWCSDWYGAYPNNQQINPTGPPTGTEKVFRGGSWYDFPVSLRSANRHRHFPDRKYTSIGLRLILDCEVAK